MIFWFKDSEHSEFDANGVIFSNLKFTKHPIMLNCAKKLNA